MIYYVTIHIIFYETQRFHYSNTFDDSLEVGTSLLVNSLTRDGNLVFLVPKKHHDEIIDQLQDNAAVIEQAELYKENIRQNPPSYLTNPNVLNNYIQVTLNTIQCLISSMIIEGYIYNDRASIFINHNNSYAFVLLSILSYHTCIEFHKI